MEWIKVCNKKSLNDRNLVRFSYDDNNNNEKKKLLIAKIHGKIYVTDGICTHKCADLSNDF
jgi:nitrite reductase/ring-hydroxylating ferredoxin subunit